MSAKADAVFDVVIVGGGVAGGGLAAALACCEGDTRVLLVEQSRRSGAIDRGDLLWPPHMELLDRWGVLPEIWRRGAVPMRASEFYDNDGTLLYRHGLGFFQSRYDHAAVLEHPQIEEALLARGAANPNLTVWRGARVHEVLEHDGAGVTLRVQRDSETVAVRASWAVAADGRGSRIREAAGIESPLRSYPYDLLMTYIPQLPRWIDTCAQFQGPRGFVGVFVVNGPHTRIAFPLPAGTYREFMQQPEEERQAAVARRAPLLRDVPLLWERTHHYKLAEHHAPSYSRGRVILIGDAAHAFTPMLGMGMNLALEDASQLAPLLASRSRLEGLDAVTLRREYEALRRPRNERIKRLSTRQGGLQVDGGPAYQWLFRTTLLLSNRFPQFGETGMRRIFA